MVSLQELCAISDNTSSCDIANNNDLVALLHVMYLSLCLCVYFIYVVYVFVMGFVASLVQLEPTYETKRRIWHNVTVHKR